MGRFTDVIGGVGIEVLASGLSVGIANVSTSPLDMIKVRMQSGDGRLGPLATGVAIVKNEGLAKLWSGIIPVVLRGFTFGGLRLGLYKPLKKEFGEEYKVCAGIVSGTIASALTSPIELIKTRKQNYKGGLGVGGNNSVALIIKDIYDKHGVKGFWKGGVPAMARAAILTSSQCVTYDESKRLLSGYMEGLRLHVCASMLAGLVTTTITNPFDVIKTRMYTGNSNLYECIEYCIKNKRLFAGWSASYLRLGPHTMIMFVSAEHIRSALGMPAV